MGTSLAQLDTSGPAPAIIVIQNQHGVKESTQYMARRCAEAGDVGIAPRRQGVERCQRADQFSQSCASADVSRLGIVGFCMGGRIAFLAAAATTSFKAAIDFYGGGCYQQWGDRPTPASLAANVSCPVQGHFGELDRNPPPGEMRKIDKEPDEIVRMLRALRNAILFLQNQREISAGLVENLLKLERPVAERFYPLYREQYNPDLTVPDSVVEEWISVGTFRAKEKITAKTQQVVDWSFAERERPARLKQLCRPGGRRFARDSS